MEYNFNSFSEEENKQDQLSSRRIADYNRIVDENFSSKVPSNEDVLETTRDISDLPEEISKQIKELQAARERIGQMNEASVSNDTPSSSQTYGGRQKVLKNPNIKTVETSSFNEDIKQILSAFISCSILSLVTATMGVGWLLYILTHV